MQIAPVVENQDRSDKPNVARVVDRAVEWLTANFLASTRYVELSLVVLDRSPEIEIILEKGGVRIESASDAATCNPTCNPRNLDLASLRKSLDTIDPDVIITFGWSGLKNLAALEWGIGRGIPVVAASDSNSHDFIRKWPKEFLKSQLLAMFSAIWAAGPCAAAYAAKLGAAPERIVEGPVNAIDCDHFAAGARAARENAATLRNKLGLPENFFLSVSRISTEKNIAGLLKAFSQYRRKALAGAWDLVLVGDGPQRLEIESLIDKLGLRQCVHLKGWQSFDELPAFYGLARAFVIASTRETWAVVINEAASTGLPLVVSAHCGAAPNFVREGVNGYTFPPEQTPVLCKCLLNLSHGQLDIETMGRASTDISQAWHPVRHAKSLEEVVSRARQLPPLNVPYWKRATLRRMVEFQAKR